MKGPLTGTRVVDLDGKLDVAVAGSGGPAAGSGSASGSDDRSVTDPREAERIGPTCA